MKYSIAGIVQREDRKILVMKRLPKGELGGKWEFPGGKLEEGENPAQAMLREWQEELEVNVLMGELLSETHFSHHGEDFTLYSYRVVPETEDWVFHEHSEARWVSVDELFQLDLADSDLTAAKVIFSQN